MDSRNIASLFRTRVYVYVYMFISLPSSSKSNNDPFPAFVPELVDRRVELLQSMPFCKLAVFSHGWTPLITHADFFFHNLNTYYSNYIRVHNTANTYFLRYAKLLKRQLQTFL